MSDLFSEYMEWQHNTFTIQSGEVSLEAKLEKLEEEYREYLENPTDGEELVDVIMVLLGLSRAIGIDLEQEFRRKFEINRNRKWGMGSNGVHRHLD